MSPSAVTYGAEAIVIAEGAGIGNVWKYPAARSNGQCLSGCIAHNGPGSRTKVPDLPQPDAANARPPRLLAHTGYAFGGASQPAFCGGWNGRRDSGPGA